MMIGRMGSPSSSSSSCCEVVLLSHESQTHTTTTTTKSNTSSILRIQTLVVDDDPTCLSIVARLLKQCSPSEDEMMKLTVTMTKSPREALRALHKENNFDIVVMNLHMHEVNGAEFQKQVVRELKIPVIVMSADDDEGLMLKTLEDGAIFYLLKPISKEDLKNVWQYAITTKRVKSTMAEIGGSYLSIEKASCHDTKSTSSVNNDIINRNGGQRRSIVSKVQTKRGRKKKAKEGDDKRYNRNGDGEFHNRATKRSKVIWTSALHTRFLHAVNHIGLDKAVPKRILQLMDEPGLTRENIASHLQKYRLFLKKLTERGGIFPSTLSQRGMRLTFASGSSSVYRGLRLEDLELMKQREHNPLFHSSYKSCNFIHPVHHNQPLSYVSRLEESSNYQAHLLRPSGGIQGSILTTSIQGIGNVIGVVENHHNQNQIQVHLPRVDDTSSYNNIGTTSQVGAHGYNGISGNSSINTQVPMQLNGANHEVIGASEPSFNSSTGLLPNNGFNGANIGLRNWVTDGYINVAPTILTRNEQSTYSPASQMPSIPTSPFQSPLSNDSNLENYLGFSPLCQQPDLLESSNEAMNNHADAINMMDNSTSTNFAGDAPSFGDNMFDDSLFDDIENTEMLLQLSNSIAPSPDINQEDGVTELTFSSGSSHYGAIEMNNLVTQLPPSNFSNELSHHTEQTTNLEVLVDASNQVQNVHGHVEPANFDIISNLELEFNPVTDKPAQKESEVEIGAQLNSTNSFLADIESILETKDWADQFVGLLDDDWTSF